MLMSRETWESSDWVQAITVGVVFICSAGMAVNWFEWLSGRTPLHVPILWTVPALIVLVIVPKRRVSLGAVSGVYAVYGLKAALLNQEPRAWFVVAAGIVVFLAVVVTAPHDYR